MKVLIGILLFILSSILNCYSQIVQDDAVHLTNIPSEGILLDKGWKFHPGDESSWSKPDFSDSEWQSIDPSLDIRHIPQIQNVPVFWLRLKLMVDSSLMDQPLGMAISQVGASEVYLDGKLLYKFGIVKNEANNENTRYFENRPFSIMLGAKKTQIIAIRYSFVKKNFLVNVGYSNPCFKIVLNEVNKTFSTSQKEANFSIIRELINVVLWLLLSMLCFGLFFSFKTQKAYLFIGVFAFLLFFGGLLGGIIARQLDSTNWVNVLRFTQSIMQIIVPVLALRGFYLLYNQNKNWFYYFIMLSGLFIIISFILFYDHAVNFYIIYFFLYSIETLRLTFKAMRHQRQGAIILLITRLLFFFFVGCTLLAYNYHNSLTLALFFGSLATAIDPFGWSLFMAGEYARTGIALQNRVIEVEGLSQKAIAQEQEKQQILTSQNETLEKRVAERTFQLNESLMSLKATQAQLIQSEKMASLGELTAGIAHEIQNPLNFVNNFSEVNTELVDELNEEAEKGNLDEVKNIAKSIKDNEQKINQHGKRADAIVKGMLQHSRMNTGQREPTDINVLIEEYLRLAYHGVRAKEKDFKATIKTDFDKSIGNINIIPQDIGRVLLNLLNNAFYAVDEKKKQTTTGFEPTISVSSKKVDGRVEIIVSDNGSGIPQKIRDKIFQPFFTTKPTGQGTGLGLSLSYDIIKAHGGEIRVDSKQAEFTEFVVQIPIV